MADIGLPKIDIVFKGLGVSALNRGKSGIAVLIVKDDTDLTFTVKTYRTISDLTSEEQARYTAENVQYIKDVLGGVPLKLIVIRMGTSDTLTDVLAQIVGIAPRNIWVALADATDEEQLDLITWIKGQIKNKKRYKAIVANADNPDDMHIVNVANSHVVFSGTRGKQPMINAIPLMLGYLAGISLDMSAVGVPVSGLIGVTEVEEPEDAVNAGKFIMETEDNIVRVIRDINSLVTTGQWITDDMKFIAIVEVMDLIYSDIYDTWKESYKGKYKNFTDNQLLFIGAVNSYFSGLALDLLLDPNFENVSSIDLEKQRLANIPKYGEETVNGWTDKKVMLMTVGTQVFLLANIKILNTFEDIEFDIFM